jgi:hypothetical protein
VLRDLGAGTARLFGFIEDVRAGSSLLLLEHLAGAVRTDDTDDVRRTMVAAARWAGVFHRRCVGCPHRRLGVHDATYFIGWGDRTLQYTAGMAHELPWLTTMVSRFRVAVEELLSHERTVVHGEFTPHNVLIAGDRVAPVDWECAAWSYGEIDIASLTDRWSRDIVEACEIAYAEARWPAGAPPELTRLLDLARCYWQLRWLGKNPAWTLRERSRWRFDALRAAAMRLELI